MRLGEGTGAALGIFLAETSARLLAEMATFSEAGVSRKEGAES
jgi:nicotinate-nucleotide--dimethylbenzimidazole phosphoribosyltransferase